MDGDFSGIDRDHVRYGFFVGPREVIIFIYRNFNLFKSDFNLLWD